MSGTMSSLLQEERRKQKGESRNIILLKKQFLIFPFSFLILLKVFIFYDCIIYYSIKTRDLELIALIDGKLTRFAFSDPLGCDYSTLRATLCCKTRDREIYLSRFTCSINFPILHDVHLHHDHQNRSRYWCQFPDLQNLSP